MVTPLHRFCVSRILKYAAGFVRLSYLAVALNGGQLAGVEIRGTVTDGVSGVGIPFARLQLSLGAGSDVIAEVSSDHDGNFAFRDVPKGSYTVSAGKNGYIAVAPGGASRLLSAADAKGVSVTLKLSQAAAITGSVLDVSGQLVRGARVAAVVRRTINGVTRMVFGGGPVETDDRGSYRIYGLAPGSYSLVLLPDGESPRGVRFGVVYFPGTIDSEAAQFLDITAGESRSGADLTMLPVAAGEVRGRVANIPSDWRQGQTAVTLLSTVGLLTQIETVQAGEGGDFDFTGVPPGTYQAVAWGPVIGMGAPLPSPGQHSEHGSRRIRIDGIELNDVEIPLHDDAVVAGAVGFEPGTNPATAACFAAGQLVLHPIDPMPNSRSLRASLGASGRFVIRDVPTGSYALELRGLTDGCFLSEARTGQARSEKGLILVEGDSTVTLLLGTQGGEVAGTVVDPEDKAVAAAVVQVVPVGGWSEAGVADVLVTSSGEDGRFSLERVPPGRYQLLAVAEVPSTDYLDPSFRKDHGTVEVEIKSRERAQVVLRMSR